MSANRCDRCANLTRFCRCDEPAAEPEPVITRRCTDCAWHMSIEYGYSSYTVEGTEVYCRKGLLPEDGIDDFYGEAKQLGVIATACPVFIAGDGGFVDVEREYLDDLTPDQREWLDNFAHPAPPEARP